MDTTTRQALADAERASARLERLQDQLACWAGNRDCLDRADMELISLMLGVIAAQVRELEVTAASPYMALERTFGILAEPATTRTTEARHG